MLPADARCRTSRPLSRRGRERIVAAGGRTLSDKPAAGKTLCGGIGRVAGRNRAAEEVKRGRERIVAAGGRTLSGKAATGQRHNAAA